MSIKEPRFRRFLRALIKRTILVVFGLSVGFAVAEIVLRIAGVSHPRSSQRDDDRGRAYRPGAEWWNRTEGEAFIRINSDGFRDKERPATKSANTVRIAVLGDSYVAALQVPVEQRFTEQLEVLLSKNGIPGSNRIEVLNFGVSGYGTAEEFLTLRHKVFRYEPDLVVLAFLTGNDLRNNSKTLQADPGRPYFVLRDGKVVLDTSFRQTSFHRQTLVKKIGYWGIDRSRVLQYLYRLRRSMIKRSMAKRRRNRVASDGSLSEVGLDNAVYQEPMGDHWKEAWKVTEGILTKMKGEVEAHQAQLLVVTLSNAAQVHPDAGRRRTFREALGVPDLFYPDRRVASVGKRESFRVLNLAPEMQRFADTNDVYLHGFENTSLGSGHWNKSGHKLAAKLIAPVIREMLVSNARE